MEKVKSCPQFQYLFAASLGFGALRLYCVL